MGVDYVLKIKVTKEEWSVQKKTDDPNCIVDVDDFFADWCTDDRLEHDELVSIGRYSWRRE